MARARLRETGVFTLSMSGIVAPMRHIAMHYHIFKNAGCTVDAILRRHFGQHFGSIENANSWSTLPGNVLLRYVCENPELGAVTSHQARLPCPQTDGIQFHPIVFLRHPVDRAGSVYAFEKRQPEDSADLGAKVARENGMAEYVRWRLKDGNGSLLWNFQTAHIARREDDRRAQISAEDLVLASDRLAALPFVGIVDRFDESIAQMRRYLFPVFGDIDTDHPPQHVSPGRQHGLEERIAEIRAELGESLYCELMDRNEYDLTLYHEAISSRLD